VTSISAFLNFLAISGRKDGSTQIWLCDMSSILKAFQSAQPLSIYQQHLNNSQPEFASPFFPLVAIPTHDEVYTLSTGVNKDYNTTSYRFGYGSPTTPQQVCEVRDVASFLSTSEFLTQSKSPFLQRGQQATIKVLKQKEAPNCDPTLYKTKRVWATASDGVKIPISIVYKPSVYDMDSTTSLTSSCPFKNPAPVLLYAYGSYGHAIDLRFSAHALSLMDRGVFYAVAHVRGGSEMGRFWYEDEGKLFKKKNTFSDYISCAEHLISTGWTIPGAIAVHGASAGGLLCGAVLNARPDLWGAVCSDVGFVDCVMSVADPSVPLAVTEWEEWGNPNQREAFDYISSYSPIENVNPPLQRPERSIRTLIAAGRVIRPQALGTGYAHPYPPILLTAGLNDSRVAYWEAAKFAAKLRDAADVAFMKHKKAGNLAALASRLVSGRGGSALEPSFTPGGNILLKTDMGAGHFSYSDRYVYEKEKAFAYSFILTALGVKI
jgi:oligopeptidase B